MVGNISNYTKIDILRCFLAIDKDISRGELVHSLNLGEGTVRTILDILKEKKFIDSTRQGHALTKKGEDIKNRIFEIISPLKKLPVSIYADYRKIGSIIRGIDTKNVTIEKRDIAVKNGAEGCMIFSYTNKLNLLIFNLHQNFNFLSKYFEFKPGDILIITFAASYKWAEISNLAVSTELSLNLKRIFNSFC
jgi:hypothetical protein